MQLVFAEIISIHRQLQPGTTNLAPCPTEWLHNYKETSLQSYKQMLPQQYLLTC